MTDNNVNYNNLTVTQSWDVPVFKSIPELVPNKPFEHKDIHKISEKFLRNLSMYDVYNSFVEKYDNYDRNKNLFLIKMLLLFFIFMFFICIIFFIRE